MRGLFYCLDSLGRLGCRESQIPYPDLSSFRSETKEPDRIVQLPSIDPSTY